MYIGPPIEPPPLPPPIPDRVEPPRRDPQPPAVPSSPSMAAITVGAVLGILGGAVASVVVYRLTAVAAAMASDPRAAALFASVARVIGVFAFLWVAAVAAFGVRFTGFPLVPIVVALYFIIRSVARRTANTPNLSIQVTSLDAGTLLLAALIWGVAGALLARRLSRGRGDRRDVIEPSHP